MSAFIVSHSLIDAVLTSASRYGVWYRKAPGVDAQINLANASEIGRILLAENERSVMHRYPGEIVSGLPGTIGETPGSYAFHERAASPLEALVGLSCLDYQSCETDDWHDTEAFRIIGALRAHYVIKLPGWENSRGWDDFDRRKEVA